MPGSLRNLCGEVNISGIREFHFINIMGMENRDDPCKVQPILRIKLPRPAHPIRGYLDQFNGKLDITHEITFWLKGKGG